MPLLGTTCPDVKNSCGIGVRNTRQLATPMVQQCKYVAHNPERENGELALGTGMIVLNIQFSFTVTARFAELSLTL